jgi:hypothetical protein
LDLSFQTRGHISPGAPENVRGVDLGNFRRELRVLTKEYKFGLRRRLHLHRADANQRRYDDHEQR